MVENCNEYNFAHFALVEKWLYEYTFKLFMPVFTYC